MSTLLLRFAGPMQSWGVQSKFDRRDTERAPSKSAVLGFLGAALGWQRNHNISELSQRLRFGTRADREGQLLVDYQTARGTGTKAYITYRHYLCDALFLVGLQGDLSLLQELSEAIQAPAFPLYLGRRSCPPEGRIVLGILPEKTLEQAFEEIPLLDAENGGGARLENVRILIECVNGSNEGFFIQDDPISFDQAKREYGFRKVTEYWMKTQQAASPSLNDMNNITGHDPMAELEE